MALPKRRFSRSRRDKRRTQLKVKIPSLTTCPECGASIVSHQICSSCGTYRGRQIIPQETKESSSK